MSSANKYTLIGFLSGMVFPVLATIIRLNYSGSPISVGGFFNMHMSEPLLWMLDTIPLAFAFTARMAGSQRQNLRETISNMHKIIDEQTRELRTTAVEAREANQAKSDFLASISHEIRTPLNGVLGMTELLLETDLKETQLEFVKTIQGSAQNQLAIINDILDFSKIEAGRLDIESIPFNIQYIIAEVAQLLSHKANEHHNVIRLQFDSDIPSSMVGDPLRIKQIIVNLASNAIKFTHRGEVIIKVAVVSDSEKWVRLRVSVRDTGIGIPLDKQKLIFERFVQADSSTTRQYGGTGLGLSIVKRLVELMNGRIDLESEKGKGSTFWFELPMSIDDITPLLTPQLDIKGQEKDFSGDIDFAQDLGVLVVEDNAVNRTVAVRMLEKLGCRVFSAENGQEALDKLQVSDYDIIFMDCQMPIMDGYDATRSIRKPTSGVKNSSIPIIAMTANAQKNDREKCLAAGMDDYISKPVKKSDFLIMLDHWISR